MVGRLRGRCWVGSVVSAWDRLSTEADSSFTTPKLKYVWGPVLSE